MANEFEGYHLNRTGDNVAALLTKIENTNILYGTTEYWNNRIGYIPPAGAIIVYTDYNNTLVDGVLTDVPGIKVGSGNGYVQDLAFITDSLYDTIMSHINNTTVHVTNQNKEFWNNKVNVLDIVTNETLVITRQ